MRQGIAVCRGWTALALIIAGMISAHVAQAQPSANFVTWINNLPTSQYTVTPGTVSNFTCNTTGPNIFTTYLGSCFGNNSATPYILINPPPPPSIGYGLPNYITSNFENPTSGTPVGYDFYQLAKNEAIVTIITLPPQAAYYSFQSYMFERQNLNLYAGTAPSPTPPATNCSPNTNYSTGGYTHKLSYDCKYQEFGYYGNTVNNADILAQSALEFNDPANPTEAIAIVTTPNMQVFSDLQTAFNSTPGLTSTQLFVDPMPGGIPSGSTAPLLQMGLHSATQSNPGDIFASIIRFTQPLSGVDGKNWVASSATNVLVYRIADTTASIANAHLYSSNALLTPSHNTNEVLGVTTNPPTCPPIGTATTQSYLCDMNELGTYLYEYIGTPANYSSASSAPASASYPGTQGIAGPFCITYGTACIGGTQDTSAYDNYNIGALPYGSPAFFIGVDHATSSINNAEYMGVSAAKAAQNIGVSDILDTNPASTFTITSATDQNGNPLKNYLYQSASTVLGILGSGYHPSTALTNDAPNLYVASFARLSSTDACNSTAFYCVSTYPFVTLITSDPSSITYPYIPAGDAILLTERDYELPFPAGSPASETGADPAYIQPGYVLYYNPSCSPMTIPCL